MDTGDLERLSGDVEDVVYYNDENGYIVLDMNVNNALVTAVGIMGDVREGEKLTLYGEYVSNAKYGRQFRVEICERSMPTDINGFRKYLGSGVIRGVGPSLAKRITENFGEETFEVIESDPLRLAELKGVTPERALEIGREFGMITGMRKAVSFFSKYTIPYGAVASAWKLYGTELIGAVRNNPYCLCGNGIELSFDDAEIIAKDLQFPADSEERIYAAIIWVLKENANEGNTCMRRNSLSETVTRKLFIGTEQFLKGLSLAVNRGDAVECGDYGEDYVYLAEYYTAEKYIASKLAEMIKRSEGEHTDCSEEISGIAFVQGIEYEQRQIDAINGCLNNHIFILTGGPGTGKTTTLQAVIELCKQRKLRIKLAAPTGRAAKRMSELTGSPAQTIHRLLEVDFSTGGNTFRRNEDNPLQCDVLIIDEMSMVDTLLFAALLRALKPSTRLVMVGDANQLPSVGAGNVLRCLIDSGRVPAIELKQIFRQAAESLIVTNAHAINEGKLPVLNDRKKDFFFMPSANEEETLRTVVELCKKRLPAAYNLDPLEDIQVLCLSRIGVLGTENLNKELQMALNPPSKNKSEILFISTLFREGDKIMQTKNDYDVEWRKGAEKSHGVFNGDIGRITETDRVNHRLRIDFDSRIAVYEEDMLKKIEHAYAITVHKSQGSEYPAVIIPLPNRMDRLSYRNLLYTAVTRAKSKLIIIGTENKIREMVNNDRRAERDTCQKEMLEEYFAENTSV